MSKQNDDDLIKAQNEVIGILFEIIKRYQANNELDEEYIQIISSPNRQKNQKHLDQIMKDREENAKIITRLLEKLKV